MIQTGLPGLFDSVQLKFCFWHGFSRKKFYTEHQMFMKDEVLLKV